MGAAQRLAGEAGWRVLHVGGALDEALAEAARRTAQAVPQYRWLGALEAAAARRRIARAHALVHMSRLEGGANAVIEAVRSEVPVLASAIDGNLGLLGDDYEGVFPVGDAQSLAALMRRFMHEPAFVQRLRAQCAAREPAFAPAAEAAAVRQLLADMLHGGEMARLPQSAASASA
jgi:glycosyltransferase involved in cell wall biosynthesis